MPVCAQCGHEFDVGRFCTNCGHPIDAAPDDAGLDLWRTDTAERAGAAGQSDTAERAGVAEHADTAERPAGSSRILPPPPPLPADTSARYPLFADQVATPDQQEPTDPGRTGRPWLPWVAGAAALAMVLLLASWLLLGGDGSDSDLVAGEPRNAQRQSPPAKKPAQPKKQNPEPAGDASDVATLATADVPATAPPGTDFDGNAVRYEAQNMLDGVATTCWRMAGDGSGETITFELAEETELTRVGLINGYAKTDTDGSGQTLDWYVGNRRVLAVEWVFDDGSVVTQDLSETRKLQHTDIEPVTTSSVELRLVTVTPPGQGPSRRDYTAISDVALVGSPV